MSLPEGCSIMREIQKTEDAVQSTYERLNELERKLDYEELPEDKQKLLKRELLEVKKLLATHEKQLAHLRTHNRKTFFFAAALMFIVFTVYMIYVLVSGGDF